MKLLKGLLIAGLIVTSATFGCKEEEEEEFVANILLNSNVERGIDIPSDWFSSDGDGQYEVDWSIEDAYSLQRSLKISSQNEIEEDFAYWVQSIRSNIPHGRDLVLKARIKGDLSGEGVSIAIRTDEGNNRLQFVTSQSDTTINGEFDWTEYSISLDDVSSETDTILVFLIYLPETSGEVYFDDVTLVVD